MVATDTIDEKPISRPAAYGLLAATAAGTTALAVAAPLVLGAGAGSVATSSAVFVTPVWRFIKRLNELYIDTGMYVSADAERLRNRFSAKPSLKATEALTAHTDIQPPCGIFRPGGDAVVGRLHGHCGAGAAGDGDGFDYRQRCVLHQACR